MSGLRIIDGANVLEPDAVTQRVDDLAHRLRAAGIAPREPVAIGLPHGVDGALTILSVRAAGATPVPIHPRLASPEAARQIEHSGARLLLGQGPKVKGVVQAQSGTALQPLDGQPEAALGDVLLYTSGTGHAPRGVLLSETALEAHAKACAPRILSGLDDVWAAPLSFAHAGGYALLDRCARWGYTLVFTGAENFDEVVKQHGVTHLSLVPTQLQRWVAARGRWKAPPTLRCVLVGGAAADVKTVERAHKYGVPARLTYGATETCGQVATAFADTPLGSVGPTLKGVDVGISDEAVHVRGPTLFSGYHRDPDATARALRDGWWDSGDLGRYDAQGNLWLLGRADDRINTGGQKVDPLEVERLVVLHEAVAEVAVAGVPNPEWGQAVTAFVVLKPGAQLDLETLRLHCKTLLSDHKLPKALRIVQELPRNPQGKVVRRQLV